MRDVHVIGTGQTPVTQGKAPSASHLSSQAVTYAIENADLDPRDVSALYPGNVTAGENQVRDARAAMTQNIGGMGATAIAHLLEAA